MEIPIRERARVPATPERLYEHITSVEGFRSFPGWGPIPGIREVTVEGGTLLDVGARTRVVNSDGSTHREVVRIVEPPYRYGIRIHDLDSAFRFIVSHVDELWELERDGDHTRVLRTFTFALRSRAWLPVALPLGHGAFRAAMRRHHRVVDAWARG
ncbi:MAG: SRPBCC family protein [Sandaracinaceae bacterium]|nr:SRPBCC family protein [Sandaracinaceae bacterium]